jgi:hypothetical protein
MVALFFVTCLLLFVIANSRTAARLFGGKPLGKESHLAPHTSVSRPRRTHSRAARRGLTRRFRCRRTFSRSGMQEMRT